ncbi:MAG: hypothetical protein IPM77_01325 [Crocinitomicaceae bacterium]|nr:hypothetical protein [Crocinitomicaceae bacterium]
MKNENSNITRELTTLQKNLFDLSARNSLIQTDPDKLWFTGDKNNLKTAGSIFSKQQFLQKEYGLNTPLLVSLFIRWKKINQTNTLLPPAL